jgi:putative acetyltransferase
MPLPALTIREEMPRDREAILAIHRAAFGSDAEADLVAGLWSDSCALFGLVAATEDEVVGHILFSQVPITTAERVITGAALPPLAVNPGWQRQGIGAALVRHGLMRCREHGVAAVVVLGDPAHSERFGFRVETAAGLRSPWSGPHLMAIELTPGGLGDGTGEAHYAAAFAALE